MSAVLAGVLRADAATHTGSVVRCLGVADRGRGIQADVVVVLNSKLTATLTTQALRVVGALNGAKVRASLTDVVKGEPFGRLHRRPVNATLSGTAKLRDGRKCAVAGEAGSLSLDGRLVRWGRVEFGIVCPDGFKFSVGVYDSRVPQPLGNGGSIPGCPS